LIKSRTESSKIKKLVECGEPAGLIGRKPAQIPQPTPRLLDLLLTAAAGCRRGPEFQIISRHRCRAISPRPRTQFQN